MLFFIPYKSDILQAQNAMKETDGASGSESMEQLQAHVEAWGTDVIPFTPPENGTPAELLLSLLSTSLQREHFVEQLTSTIIPERKRLSVLTTTDPTDKTEVNANPEPARGTTLTPGQERIVPDAPPKKRASKPSVKQTVTKDADGLWFDPAEGLIGHGKKKSPVMFAHQIEMLKRLNASCGQVLSVAQLAGEDNVDTATVAKIEQSIKRLVADLEKDPTDPKLFSVIGSGKGLSVRLNHSIAIIKRQ